MKKRLFIILTILLNINFIVKLNSQQRFYSTSNEIETLAKNIIEFYESKKSLPIEKIKDAFKADDFRNKFLQPLSKLSFSDLKSFLNHLDALKIPDYLRTYFLDHLGLNTGQDINEIIAIYFKNLPKPDEKKLYSNAKTFEEFLRMYVNNVLSPQPEYKRQFALSIFDSYDRGKLLPLIVDKKSFDDLRIFNGLSELAEKICKAKTEVGKVFFMRKLASPLKDKKALEEQKTLIQTLSSNDLKVTFDKINLLLESLSEYENGVFGFWREDDCHVQNFKYSCGSNKLPIVSDIPILGQLSKVIEWGKKYTDNQAIKKLASFYDTAGNLENKALSEGMQLTDVSLTIINAVSSIAEILEKGKNIGKIFLKLIMPQFIPAAASIVGGPAWKMLSYADHLNNFDKVFSDAKSKYFLVKSLALRLKYVARYIKIVKKIQAELEKVKHKSVVYQDLSNRLSLTKELEELDKLLQAKDFKGELKVESAKLYQKILTTSGKVAQAYQKFEKCKNDLISLMTAIGELDAQMSIVRLLKENDKNAKEFGNDYCMAEFDFDSENPYMSINDYWNPILGKEIAVSNSIGIGGLCPRSVIVSGPNAGGKSANTKIININAMLAQSLGIAPAKKYKATPFAKIQAYLNIKDDQAKGDSLFQAEVLRGEELYRIAKAAESTKSSESKNFVLTYFDEPYRGTNALYGSIISFNKQKQFADLSNTLTLTTTHFPRLANLAKEEPKKFRNLKVDSKKVDNEFSYKLLEGFSEECNAFDVLHELGADSKLIELCANLLKIENDKIEFAKINDLIRPIFNNLSPVILNKRTFLTDDIINNLLLITNSSRAFIDSNGKHIILSNAENEKIKQAIIEAIKSEDKALPKDNSFNELASKDYKAYFILGYLLNEYHDFDHKPINAWKILWDTLHESNDPVLMAKANFSLAKMYYKAAQKLTGEKLKERLELALKFINVAFKQDHDLWAKYGAQMLLAKMYYFGHGVAKDLLQAKEQTILPSCQVLNIPAKLEAYYLQGLIELNVGNHGIAKYNFGRALEHDHKEEYRGDIHYQMVTNSQISLADSEKEYHFKKAEELIKDESKRGNLFYELAWFYKAKGLIDKAIDKFEEAGKLLQDNYKKFSAIFYAAEIYQYEKRNLEKAKESYNKIIQAYTNKLINPCSCIEAYANLGEIYFEQKNYNDAITYFENSIKTDNEEKRIVLKKELAVSKSLYYLGRIYIECLSENALDTDKAINYFLECLNINSSNKLYIDKSKIYLAELIFEVCYEAGVFIKKLALDYLNEVSIQGDAELKAHVNLLWGLIYETGLSKHGHEIKFSADIDKANGYFIAASSQSINLRAQKISSELLNKKNINKAKNFFIRHCKKSYEYLIQNLIAQAEAELNKKIPGTNYYPDKTKLNIERIMIKGDFLKKTFDSEWYLKEIFNETLIALIKKAGLSKAQEDEKKYNLYFETVKKKYV